MIIRRKFDCTYRNKYIISDEHSITRITPRRDESNLSLKSF